MKVKKIMLLVLVMLLASTTSFALTINYDGIEREYTGPNVKLVLNDITFVPSAEQMPPIIIEDRTLVPVREVFELLGGKVDWDGTNRKVNVTIDNTTVELTIDGRVATVNGKNEMLDVTAKIINNKTMVPVRFISESCGLKVDWDGTTSTVTINKPVVETNLASIFESAEYKNKKSELIDSFDELINSSDEDDSFVKIYNMCDESKESFIDFLYYMACINDLGGTFNIPIPDFQTMKSYGGSKVYAKYSELKEYAIENEINVSYPTIYYMIAENLSFDDIKAKGLTNFAYPANEKNKSKVTTDFMCVTSGYNRSYLEARKEAIAENSVEFLKHYALYEIKDISTLDSKYTNSTKWTKDNSNQKIYVSSLGEICMLPGYPLKMKDGSTFYFTSDRNYYIISSNPDSVEDKGGIILDKLLDESSFSQFKPVEKVNDDSPYKPSFTIEDTNKRKVNEFNDKLSMRGISGIISNIGSTRLYTRYELDDENILTYLVSKYSLDEIMDLYNNDNIPKEKLPVGYKLPDKIKEAIKSSSFKMGEEEPIVAYLIDDSKVPGYDGTPIYNADEEKHYITNTGDVIVLPGMKIIEQDGTEKYYFGAYKYYTLDKNEKPITLAETYGIDANGKIIH